MQVKETGMTFYLSAQKVRQTKVIHPKHYKNLNESFGGWAVREVLKISAILLFKYPTFARFLFFEVSVLCSVHTKSEKTDNFGLKVYFYGSSRLNM